MDNYYLKLVTHNVHSLAHYEHRTEFTNRILYPPLPIPRRDLSSGNTLHPRMEQSFLQELQYDLTFANLTSAKGGLITGFRRSLSYCVHDHATLFTGEASNVYSQALLVHCTVNDVENGYCQCLFSPTPQCGKTGGIPAVAC